MGAIFRKEHKPQHTGLIVNDEEVVVIVEVHTSTGKYPFPEGEIHRPEWGEWHHEDQGMFVRNCEFSDGACDMQDYKTEPGGKFVPLEGGTFDMVAAKDDGTVEIVHQDADGTIIQHHRGEDAPSSEWAHTAVTASFPSGTDPLAALRASMAVFMERKDGSNALAPWQQVRWWHGGPTGLRKGSKLLPPSESGHRPGLDFTDKEAVYITSDRNAAIMFAARHDRPCLYEVTGFEWLDGATEPSPDDVIPGDPTSARVKTATIHRIEQISALELRRTLYELSATRDDAIAGDQGESDG